MSGDAYEYKGLMAEAWDVLRGDTSRWADRAYYLEAIERYGEPALDVGCGTGRLLIDYRQQGVDIDGVDNSPDMLALCGAKAAEVGVDVDLYEQYVETLDLPRRYQTILVPSSSLQLIIDPAAVEQSMKRLVDHLQPRGWVVASIMTLWREGEPLESQWERSAVRDADGAIFRRVAWSRFDPATQREETRDLYQKIVDGEVVTEEQHSRSPATRSYSQAGARELFEAAGLVDVELNSEFTWQPAKPGDRVFTVHGRRD